MEYEVVMQRGEKLYLLIRPGEDIHDKATEARVLDIETEDGPGQSLSEWRPAGRYLKWGYWERFRGSTEQAHQLIAIATRLGRTEEA